MRGRFVFAVAGFGLVAFRGVAEGAGTCPAPLGALVAIEGQVEFRDHPGAAWRAAPVNAPLCPGATVRVGNRSRATATLPDAPTYRIDQNTTFHLVSAPARRERPAMIRLVEGALYIFSRRPRTLTVETPLVDAAVEGTEFLVRVDPTRATISVFEGTVTARNERGQAKAKAGQVAIAAAGRAPVTQLMIRPQDAVEWALHYPPILALLADPRAVAEPGVPQPVREAAKRTARGDIAGALARLEAVPAGERRASFHLYRAAILLSVGRVDEARANIDRALAQDPTAGLAYALKAVIAVAQNDNDAALAAGRRGVELEPASAAARIALSYAQQARFDLDGARESLRRAVEAEPKDALAWARLSELWLMAGRRDRARQAAETAADLSPDLARVQSVLGFAALAEFRAQTARQAFERALARDPADPTARFGLGLARIRRGDLEAGRNDIEAAVALDPNRSLLRSYLGKAYFEERTGNPLTYLRELAENFPNQENTLAAEQFAIAKKLDPKDPTPFLYDAIRLQSENRPVEALRDLERSIELNDNRAVYRSRLALDADRAARQTSLARIYNDLGFTQLGQNQSSRSLALDPGNSSAHRFLSDTYLSVRRREIARVSELLQAQMLQDVNLNPVQPSISETNLNIVTRGGPADAGFNEFTPMFERNGAQFNATGVVGNNNTYGGEAVISGLYDRFSVSGGGFYYDTDGWRANNDLNHKIGSFFAQAAITPKLNIQGEFRHRDSEFGDLPFNFDRNAFLRDENNEQTVDMARVGLRYSPSANADLLVSFIHSERDEKRKQTIPFADPVLGEIDIENKARVDDDANQIETAGIYRWDRVNLTGGFGYYDVQRDMRIATAFGDEPLPDFRQKPDISDYRGYLYTNVVYPATVTWTFGASIDRYREDDFDVDKLNPKVGARWAVTPDVSLRAAYFRVVKPPLVANRTLEPTQIAGFNQFFDDINGTASTRWGIGADWALTRTLSVGAEATWREFDEPTTVITGTDTTTTDTENGDEELHRLYAYWTPFARWAFSTGLSYDKYKINRFEGDPLPEKVETISLPLTATYFDPGGFFAGAGVSYVHQKVDRLAEFSNQGTSTFAVVDAGVGYRLANRRGIASLSARNLFDTAFQYQDDSYREFRDEPYVGPYFPERTVVARVNLNF